MECLESQFLYLLITCIVIERKLWPRDELRILQMLSKTCHYNHFLPMSTSHAPLFSPRNIISGPTRTAPRQAPEGSYFMHHDLIYNLSRILLISNASLANRFGSSAATHFHNSSVPFSNMIRRHYTPSYAHVVPRGYTSIYHNV